MTQTQAAKVLGITQSRVSDLKRGKINLFSLDLLIRLAAREPFGPGCDHSGPGVNLGTSPECSFRLTTPLELLPHPKPISQLAFVV